MSVLIFKKCGSHILKKSSLIKPFIKHTYCQKNVKKWLQIQSPNILKYYDVLENFHRLHSVMSILKLSVLEEEKKSAKVKYNAALEGYIKQYFGRPLEKLNVSIIIHMILIF